MKEKKFDLYEAARSFAENRDRMTQHLGSVGDMIVVKQVRKILKTGDNSQIYLLIQLLNACCRHSPRRYSLLKYRLGRNTVIKLEREGFHMCDCSVWATVGKKKTNRRW